MLLKGGIQHLLISNTNELLTSLQDNTCRKKAKRGRREANNTYLRPRTSNINYPPFSTTFTSSHGLHFTPIFRNADRLQARSKYIVYINGQLNSLRRQNIRAFHHRLGCSLGPWLDPSRWGSYKMTMFQVEVDAEWDQGLTSRGILRVEFFSAAKPPEQVCRSKEPWCHSCTNE